MKFVKVICIIGISSLFTACWNSDIKETINQTGDVAGQAIGELSSGIKNGVKKAIQPKIETDSSFVVKGLELGKVIVESDSGSKSDNVLIAYLVFTKNWSGAVKAIAFDSDNKEMGRCSINVKGKSDEGKFVEFHFDPRTDIANDSRIVLY